MCNKGALIPRISFWGMLYYNHDKDNPKTKIAKVIVKATSIGRFQNLGATKRARNKASSETTGGCALGSYISSVPSGPPEVASLSPRSLLGLCCALPGTGLGL